MSDKLQQMIPMLKTLNSIEKKYPSINIVFRTRISSKRQLINYFIESFNNLNTEYKNEHGKNILNEYKPVATFYTTGLTLLDRNKPDQLARSNDINIPYTDGLYVYTQMQELYIFHDISMEEIEDEFNNYFSHVFEPIFSTTGPVFSTTAVIGININFFGNQPFNTIFYHKKYIHTLLKSIKIIDEKYTMINLLSLLHNFRYDHVEENMMIINVAFNDGNDSLLQNIYDNLVLEN